MASYVLGKTGVMKVVMQFVESTKLERLPESAVMRPNVIQENAIKPC